MMAPEVPPSARTGALASSVSSDGEETVPMAGTLQVRRRSRSLSRSGGLSPRSGGTASDVLSRASGSSYAMLPSCSPTRIFTASPRNTVNQQVNIAVNPDAGRQLALVQKVMVQLEMVIHDQHAFYQLEMRRADQ